jgi:virginiamycin A acetyltransferase
VAKRLGKHLVYGIFFALVWPAAALTGFGRWEPIFKIFANAFSLAPGIVGDYIRCAYYRLTLAEWHLSSRIEFGSFFAHADARIGPRVYIGSYCILGRTEIGEHTHVASGVQILSGRHQHPRDGSGRITGSEGGVFTPVIVGPDCWIGAGALVMADVGEASTVGAGAVVVHPIPAGCVSVGNPAKVIKSVFQTRAAG